MRTFHRFIAQLASISLIALSASAQAQTLPAERIGKIVTVFSDPIDIVVKLDVNGPCGDNHYVIQRSATNFHELTALIYTAAAQRQPAGLTVSACQDPRNIVSHGGVSF